MGLEEQLKTEKIKNIEPLFSTIPSLGLRIDATIQFLIPPRYEKDKVTKPSIPGFKLKDVKTDRIYNCVVENINPDRFNIGDRLKLRIAKIEEETIYLKQRVEKGDIILAHIGHKGEQGDFLFSCLGYRGVVKEVVEGVSLNVGRYYRVKVMKVSRTREDLVFCQAIEEISSEYYGENYDVIERKD